MVDRATRRVVLGENESDRYDSDLQAALERLNEKGRRVIQHARLRKHGVVLRQLIHKSPLLWPLVVPDLALAGSTLRNAGSNGGRRNGSIKGSRCAAGFGLLYLAGIYQNALQR